MHFPFSRIVSHKDSPLSLPSYNARQKSGGGKTKDPFPNGENFTPLPQQEEERILELLDSSQNHLSFLPPPENGNLEEFSAEFSLFVLDVKKTPSPPPPPPNGSNFGPDFSCGPLNFPDSDLRSETWAKNYQFFLPGRFFPWKNPREEGGGGWKRCDRWIIWFFGLWSLDREEGEVKSCRKRGEEKEKRKTPIRTKRRKFGGP